MLIFLQFLSNSFIASWNNPKHSKINKIEGGIIKFAGVNKIVPIILAKQKLQKRLKNNGGPDYSTKTVWVPTLIEYYDSNGNKLFKTENDQSENGD